MNLTISPNLKPIISNITVNEMIIVDGSSVILDKCKVNEDIDGNIKIRQQVGGLLFHSKKLRSSQRQLQSIWESSLHQQNASILRTNMKAIQSSSVLNVMKYYQRRPSQRNEYSPLNAPVIKLN